MKQILIFFLLLGCNTAIFGQNKENMPDYDITNYLDFKIIRMTHYQVMDRTGKFDKREIQHDWDGLQFSFSAKRILFPVTGEIDSSDQAVLAYLYSRAVNVFRTKYFVRLYIDDCPNLFGEKPENGVALITLIKDGDKFNELVLSWITGWNTFERKLHIVFFQVDEPLFNIKTVFPGLPVYVPKMEDSSFPFSSFFFDDYLRF